MQKNCETGPSIILKRFRKLEMDGDELQCISCKPIVEKVKPKGYKEKHPSKSDELQNTSYKTLAEKAKPKGYEEIPMVKSTESWWPEKLSIWKQANIHSVVKFDETDIFDVLKKVNLLLFKHKMAPMDGIEQFFIVVPNIESIEQLAFLLTDNVGYFCWYSSGFIVIEANHDYDDNHDYDEPGAC